jgi:hypothetical protein
MSRASSIRTLLPLDHSDIIGMTLKRTILMSLSYASVKAVTLRRSFVSRVSWEGQSLDDIPSEVEKV